MVSFNVFVVPSTWVQANLDVELLTHLITWWFSCQNYIIISMFDLTCGRLISLHIFQNIFRFDTQTPKLTLSSTRALITLPRVERDLLMTFASSSVLPSAPDLETFSLPAKSTRFSLPSNVSPLSRFLWIIVTMKMLWLRELCVFIANKTKGSGIR